MFCSRHYGPNASSSFSAEMKHVAAQGAHPSIKWRSVHAGQPAVGATTGSTTGRSTSSWRCSLQACAHVKAPSTSARQARNAASRFRDERPLADDSRRERKPLAPPGRARGAQSQQAGTTPGPVRPFMTRPRAQGRRLRQARPGPRASLVRPGRSLANGANDRPDSEPPPGRASRRPSR